jgi:hypothetical protein
MCRVGDPVAVGCVLHAQEHGGVLLQVCHVTAHVTRMTFSEGGTTTTAAADDIQTVA